MPGPNGGWVLEVVPWGRRQVFRSCHPSLSAARSWATHHERLAARRANRVRHGSIAIVCTVLWIYLVFLLGPHGSTGRIFVFSSAVLLFFLAMHEMAELLDSVIPGDESDRRNPAAVPADHVLESAVSRWFEGPSSPAAGDQTPITIIAIPDDDAPR
jgi:hypothetical protein